MQETQFYIGQIIEHILFDYKGIIFDVDFEYSGTDDWYNKVAHSRPSKNQPWYRVLVDNATHQTYVAEQNLRKTSQQSIINNPLLDLYFKRSKDNEYSIKLKNN